MGLALVASVAAMAAAASAQPSAPPAVSGARGGAPDPVLSLRLEHAAFDLPDGVPNVVVRLGAGARPPARVHVLLHGFRGCAEVLVRSGPTRCGTRGPARRGWALGDSFAAAAPEGLLVVPQLALLARDGSPGRLARDGYLRALLDELRAAIVERRGAAAAPIADAPITLLAHSAGFEAALAVLARGGLDARIDRVVLFDALYAGAPRFLEWVAADSRRTLVSIHTGRGATAASSRALARAARERLGEGAVVEGTRAPREAGAARVVVLETNAPHGEVPARHFADALR